MSRFAITPAVAISDSRLSPRDITVLGAVGTFSDKNGYAFPSVSTLGGMLGITRQAVQKSIGKLVACGYLEKQARARSDGSQTSNLIRVVMDVEPPEAVLRRSAGGATSRVAGGATPRVAGTARSGVAGAATSRVARSTPNELPNELPIEHSQEEQEEVAQERTDEQRAFDVPPELELAPAMVAEFVTHCRERGKPLTGPGWRAVVHRLSELHTAGVDLNESLRVTMAQSYVIPCDPTQGKAGRIARRQREQQRRVDADVRLAERTLPPSRPDREGAWAP